MTYPVRCEFHPTHCDECMVCIQFDSAVKRALSNYTLPPSQHPSVIGPQVKEWMEKMFPTR